ncbi:cytochrome P450 [Cyathus striatus]|nr:cytochrome P450 [Cyathus striatus]
MFEYSGYWDKQHVLAVIVSVLIIVYIFYNGETRKLRHIPTIGFGWPLLSYISAIKFMVTGHAMVQDGYDKHKGGAFKVPLLHRWIVVVSGTEHFEELKRVSDEHLSAPLALDEIIQVSHTMGREVTYNPYHIPIIRSQLTRNLGVLFPEMRDELVTALTEHIPLSEGWEKYPIMNTLLPVISRTTNRVLVGLPLCRNLELIRIGINFTTDVMTVSTIMNMLPSFTHPLAAFILTGASRNVRRTMKLIAHVVEERKKLQKTGFSGAESPVFLTWLLEDAIDQEQSLEKLARRLLALNFSAIHTTTLTFLQVLYNLAARKEYVKPLREEVDNAISQEGWTRAAVEKMKKIDSFIRETQRLYPLCIPSLRMVMEDYTFQNGTFLPKGTMVTIPVEPVHTDPSNYPNADQFDGFRFSKVTEDGSRRFEIVALSNEFLPFGIGKHGCPGRFFAANELKLLLAHIVYHYDVKFENEGVRPDDLFIGASRIPNTKAEVMFRKRSRVRT